MNTLGLVNVLNNDGNVLIGACCKGEHVGEGGHNE